MVITRESTIVNYHTRDLSVLVLYSARLPWYTETKGDGANSGLLGSGSTCLSDMHLYIVEQLQIGKTNSSTYCNPPYVFVIVWIMPNKVK